MGPKILGVPPPFWEGEAVYPYNTKSSTSTPSGILIHAAIWPQQLWAEIGGCVPFREGVTGSPSNTMWPGHAEFHLDPSNCLATVHQRHMQTQDRQTDRQTDKTTVQ